MSFDYSQFVIPGGVRGIKNSTRMLNFPAPSDLLRSGNSEYDYGRGITQEGLANANSDAAGYQSEIAAGGLPEDLRQQFRVLRGSLSDNAVRMNRDYLAKLKQRFLTSGGQMAPGAENEYDLENQKNTGENLFTATNNANMSEANMALTNTNALRDRIDAIRKMVLGVGQSEEDRARQAQIEAMKTQMEHRRAISSFFKFW